MPKVFFIFFITLIFARNITASEPKQSPQRRVSVYLSHVPELAENGSSISRTSPKDKDKEQSPKGPPPEETKNPASPKSPTSAKTSPILKLFRRSSKELGSQDSLPTQEKEKFLTEKLVEVKKLEVVVRARIISDVVNDRNYMGCKGRLAFLDLHIEDRKHEAEVELKKIHMYGAYKSQNYTEERTASVAVCWQSFYSMRTALIEKFVMEDPDKPPFKYELKVDKQLQELRAKLEALEKNLPKNEAEEDKIKLEQAIEK